MKQKNKWIYQIIEHFQSEFAPVAIIFFLIAFLANHFAQAQSNINGKSKTMSKMKSKKFVDDSYSNSLRKKINFQSQKSNKDWQINLGLTAGQKAIKDGSDSQKGISDYTFSTETSLKLTESMSLKSILNYYRYPNNNLQDDVSDLLLNLYVARVRLNRDINLIPYLNSTLPLSKDSRDRQQMNLGVGGGVAISQSSSLRQWNFTWASSLSAHKYSHRFETATNGTINTSHASTQHVSLAAERGPFGASLMFRHINSWNYSQKMRESFMHAQSLDWSPGSQVSFSLGHTNSGSVLSPNQEDVEIRLIDENSSMVYLSTNITF